MKSINVSWPQAKYLGYELSRRRSLSDLDAFTQTLQDARVDLNPHQVECALFAFRSPLSGGAILADEVGLGKTIEAGIILSQKWAERKRKLLIIAPANLRKQWLEELEEKFFLPSFILDRKEFNRLLEEEKLLNPFESNEIVICSYDFARRYHRYLQKAQLDLVVLDEAHRLRNVYRNDNKTGRVLHTALFNKKKILLTATPLQNSLLELYGLASFVDIYTFGDLKSFKARYSKELSKEDYDSLKRRLAPICQRTLRRQVLEYINYTERLPILEEYVPSDREAELYNLVTEFLQRKVIHTIKTSQRALTTLVLRKLLASSSFAISDTLNNLIIRIDEQLEKHSEIASLEESMPDYEGLQVLLDESPDEVYSDEPVAVGSLIDEETYEQMIEEREWLVRCKDLALNIKTNSKAERLLTALDRGFDKLEELGAKQKALIFTESRRTQEFLYNFLSEQGYEGKLVTFNGTNDEPRNKDLLKKWRKENKSAGRVTGVRDADMRAALVDRFRNDAVIMIATEAAAEGINLQFCSLVVNYDLPWNPQRIEQRIGRCHRYGQKYDVVVINFLNRSNAADVRVYELLDEKFKLFSGVFGASDEVLGSISSGTDFEQRINQIYQNCRSEAEIQEAFDALKEELSPQIDERMQQARSTLLEHFDDEVRQRLKDSELESRRLLKQYEEQLWMLTQYILRKKAKFSVDKYTFTLCEDIVGISDSGPYYMLESEKRKLDNEQDHKGVLFRANHPLAQHIIEQSKTLDASLPDIWVINYSASDKRISPIADLVGSEGYISVDLLSIEAADTVDYLIEVAVLSDGEQVANEIIKHLWTLPSTVELDDRDIPSNIRQRLSEIKQHEQGFVDDLAKKRSIELFDEEIEKLDRWADDMKLGLEKEIKDLDATIKLSKSIARKEDSIQGRVAAQRQIKEMEKQYKEKQKNYFEELDRIDAEKDKLIDDLEQLLKVKKHEEKLFTLRWKIV